MNALNFTARALHGKGRNSLPNTARRINNTNSSSRRCSTQFSSIYLQQWHSLSSAKREDEEGRDLDNYSLATVRSRAFCQLQPPPTYAILSRHISPSKIIPSNCRYYHSTPTQERYAAIVMTLGAVAATAKAGQYAVEGYNEWKAAQKKEIEEREILERQSKPDGREDEPFTTSEGGSGAAGKSDSSSSQSGSGSGGGGATTGEGAEKAAEGKRENIFASFFNMAVGTKYYEGEILLLYNIIILLLCLST